LFEYGDTKYGFLCSSSDELKFVKNKILHALDLEDLKNIEVREVNRDEVHTINMSCTVFDENSYREFYDN
jgi:hypothetical protein